MTVDCLAYADLAQLLRLASNQQRADKIGYVLLEILGRSTFEYLSFAVVTALWLLTAAEARLTLNASFYQLAFKIVVGWATLLVTVSLIQATDIALSSSSSGEMTTTDKISDEDHVMFWTGSKWSYRTHLLVEGLSWAFQALMSAACLVLTRQSIVRVATWPQSTSWTKMRTLSKALLPMMLCIHCYATRAILLLIQFVRLPSRHTSSSERQESSWWIWFVWIPTIVPSLLLLYSARKRDATTMTMRPHAGAAGQVLSVTTRSSNSNNYNDDADGSATAPLISTISTPVPPAEAFISFRRFTQEADFMSPLANMTAEIEEVNRLPALQEQDRNNDDRDDDADDIERAPTEMPPSEHEDDIAAGMTTTTTATETNGGTTITNNYSPPGMWSSR